MNKYLDEAARLLNPRFRWLAPEAGDGGCSEMFVRDISAERREVVAVMSTPEVDRYEEIVEPKAFSKWLPAFMRNPVLMPSHQYTRDDGGPAQLGIWKDVKVTETGLEGVAQFHAHTRQAEEWWSLYRDGIGRGFSVGWLTHAFEMRDVQAKAEKRKMRVFTEVELIECSPTPIPANRGSLAEGKAHGTRSVDGAAVVDAKALAELLKTDLASAVAAELKNVLNPDPGGLLCSLIQECVAAAQCHPGHDHGDDSRALAPEQREELRAGIARLKELTPR